MAATAQLINNQKKSAADAKHGDESVQAAEYKIQNFINVTNNIYIKGDAQTAGSNEIRFELFRAKTPDESNKWNARKLSEAAAQRYDEQTPDLKMEFVERTDGFA